MALLLVDVDELKGVNDARGHASGDQLLTALGRIALAAMRRTDRAFRVGGDEFAVILPGSSIDDGLSVARRILASALSGGDPSAPIEPFSLSIGVSAIPLPSAEGHQLYRHADAALYWCKRHGRTSAVAYDPGRHGRTTDERSVADLAAAVSGIVSANQLAAVYQPIVSLATGRPIGFEGLVRPAEGAAFPDASSLFAAAEIADRSVELDLACIKIVAEGIRPDEPGAYLSVNVSPRTLESDLFQLSDFMSIFKRRGIQPDQIVLEMTERESVEDLDQLRRNVAACRKAGIRIAADDVGAGNAGLRLLSEIQFDILKVDLSLVQGGIVHDPSYAVLRGLQEMADRWGAIVVAEGVETPEQLAVLRRLGIGAAQGYLLGRPSAVPSIQPIDLDAMSAVSDMPLDVALRRSRDSSAA
ncbi:MAG: bifunctional diguanylate cyclase/phosphodiesterase [Chloroflexota bacterium]